MEASGLDEHWVDLLIEEDAESRDSIPGRYRIHGEAWDTVVELLHARFAPGHIQEVLAALGARPSAAKRKAAAKRTR